MHDEIHAVAGARLAELFAQIYGLQQDGHDFAFGMSLLASCDSAAHDSGRQQDDQQYQHDTEQGLPILGRGDRIGLEIGEHDAADDRAR